MRKRFARVIDSYKYVVVYEHPHAPNAEAMAGFDTLREARADAGRRNREALAAWGPPVKTPFGIYYVRVPHGQISFAVDPWIRGFKPGKMTPEAIALGRVGHDRHHNGQPIGV